jgi:nanoRNase/pAp phosphatase (c-di-AMP/oligoRNAs hydrolase)
MNPVSAGMRERANQFRTAADTLLTPENADALKSDVRQQISAIVGKVSAVVLDATADALDSLRGQVAIDAAMQKRQVFMEKNDAIRRASAAGFRSGDWSEFDKLAAGLVGPVDGGGGPSGGGTAT